MVLPFPPSAGPGLPDLGGLPGMPGLEPPQTPSEPGLALFSLLPPELLTSSYGTPMRGYPRPQSPPPDEGTLQLRIQQVKNLWAERDRRMDEDEDLYYMVEAERTPGAVIRNIPRVVVDKVAAMVGGQVPIITVIAPSAQLDDLRERSEDLCRHMRDEWDRRWQDSGFTSLNHAMAFYLALRGWVAARTTYDPYVEADEIPVELWLFDPRNVYPMPGRRGWRFVVHVQHSTVSEVLDEWPEAEPELGGRELDEQVEVAAYYDRDYHALFIDNKLIRPATPHGYGFLPWTIRISGGTPSRGTNRTGGSTEWTKHVGPSIFHGAREAIKRLDSLYTQLSTIVETASNPPVVMRWDQTRGQAEPISLEPGATNYIFPSESIEILRAAPLPTDLAPLLNGLNSDVERGTIPDVLWGTMGSESGFAIALQSGAARDALYGVVTALQSAWEDIFRKSLTLIRDLHYQPVGIVVRDANGNWVSGETVSPQDIAKVGTKVKVQFKDVSPQDKFRMAQLGIALADKQLISKETAREDYLGIENARKENAKIIQELPYQDPEFMRGFLVPYMLFKTDPEMFALWMAMQRFKQASSPPTPPPGAAPPEPSGVPPFPGVPPTVAPAPMGPELFDAMAQAAASAAGGADQRREEGLPGIGGIFPGGLGVT